MKHGVILLKDLPELFPAMVMKQSLAVDALGLRPLWMLETVSSYLFSSEPGIIPSTEFVNDPKPLAPGEKVGFKWDRDELKCFMFKRLSRRSLSIVFQNEFRLQGTANHLKPFILEKTNIPYQSTAKIS